jgi:hypothetical protein
MDWLVKGLIAVGGYLLADAAVKETTGKHIHQHAVELWNRLRDRILAWAGEQGFTEVHNVIMEIDSVFQNTYKAVDAKVKLHVVDGTGRVQVKEEVVSVEELREMGIADCTPGISYDVSEQVLES